MSAKSKIDERKPFPVRLFVKLLGLGIKLLWPVRVRLYMRVYVRYLRWRGMVIDGSPRYIGAWVDFDERDLSRISIGHDAVLSSGVKVLCHDYSLTRALLAAEEPITHEVAMLRPVSVGANSFVGKHAILMPGCELGRNCIVGAGSVVRGRIPDNSILMGNPAIVVGNTIEWARKKKAALASEFAVWDHDAFRECPPGQTPLGPDSQ